MSEEIQPLGQVTHYFDRISVAVIRLWDTLTLGDWVHFYGNKTNFVQQVQSMQINHQPVDAAYAEDEVAVLVEDRVRKGDWVYPYQPENYE
ncbi:MAG TPA: translation elongation factor-like protein [Chloroflexi bacterium]|nr:translation elongation factor-like protein [Chloroflexota bacterium]